MPAVGCSRQSWVVSTARGREVSVDDMGAFLRATGMGKVCSRENGFVCGILANK